MTITVDVEPLREAVRERYRQVADDAFQAMLVDMEANAPRDTGAMTQTITVDEHDSDTSIGRTIHAPQPYSSYQDVGTGVYVGEGRIYPTTAKVLHFVAKDGTEVFVRSVAGTPPTNWWSDPTGRLGDYLQAAMQ